MAESVKCPKCGSTTVLRTVVKGSNAGLSFHVCTRYPDCKGRIPIKESTQQQVSKSGMTTDAKLDVKAAVPAKESTQQQARRSGSKEWAKAIELWLTYHLEGSSEFDTEILRLLNSAIELGLDTFEETTARYQRGEIYISQERFSEAQVDLEKALELNKRSEKTMFCHDISGTWQNLSTIHTKQGNRAQAIKCLEEGIRQLQNEYNREDPEMLKWELITLYCKLALKYEGHDNGQALSIYLRALEIDPHAPMLRLLLGEFYCNKEERPEFYNPQKAIEHWEQYLALEKEDSPEDRNQKQRVQKNLEILKTEEA
jgi:tetratricopeptide (TPR) repeat protein